MKLNDAVRKFVRQYGMSVIHERRLLSFLADYRAFDDFPAAKPVIESIVTDGYGNELCRLATVGNDADCLSYAGQLKQLLVREKKFDQKSVSYAVDCVSFALDLIPSVQEPSNHGSNPVQNRSGHQNSPGTQAGGSTTHAPNAKPSGNKRKLSKKDAEDIRRWFSLAKDYYNGENGKEKDYRMAVYYFRKAAVLGDPDSQMYLGLAYEWGEGVEKSHAEALNWYRQAAENGERCSQYDLGKAYYYGHDVKQNYAESVNWFRKSAEQGYGPAQCSLGCAYYYGQGTEQNETEALRWWRKAAAESSDAALIFYEAVGHDDAHSQYQLGELFWYQREELYRKGEFTCGDWDFKQDYEEAVKWYLKAAEHGYDKAQCQLGVVYYSGKGVERNVTEALKWWQKAADQGNDAAGLLCRAVGENDAEAQYQLGNLYRNKKNYEKSAKWYRKAADQGCKAAQVILRVDGDFLYKVGYNSSDPCEAARWYKKAADLGNRDAELLLGLIDAHQQYSIGLMYEEGDGVRKDYEEAVEWYREAASVGYSPARDKLKKLGMVLRIKHIATWLIGLSILAIIAVLFPYAVLLFVVLAIIFLMSDKKSH